MRIRDTLSNLTLTVLGAAALTAGALLYQITRRPSPEGTSAAPSAEGSDSAAGPSADLGELRPGEIAFQKDESLLRRLRERGL